MSALPLTFLASLSFTLNIWQSLSNPPGSPCICASAAVQRHFSQGTMGHQRVVSSIVRSKPASCAQISSADSINRAKSARGLVSVKSHTEIGPSSIAHCTMMTSTVWAYFAFPNLKLGPRVSQSIQSFTHSRNENKNNQDHELFGNRDPPLHNRFLPLFVLRRRAYQSIKCF